MSTSLGHILCNHSIQLWDILNTTMHFMWSWPQNSQMVFAISDMAPELMQKGNLSQYSEMLSVSPLDMIYSGSRIRLNNFNSAIRIQTCCTRWIVVCSSRKSAAVQCTKNGHIRFSKNVAIGFCHRLSKNKMIYCRSSIAVILSNEQLHTRATRRLRNWDT